MQECCERVNLLSMPPVYTEGCRFVNITEEEDFTSDRGVKVAIDARTGPQDAVWLAPPCTGGAGRPARGGAGRPARLSEANL